jgi:hypothetical protein
VEILGGTLMTGAREVWAEAAARAVVKVASRASGDDSLALVHAALRRSDDAAPEITVVRSSDLADRAAVRAAIFDGHFGRSVREYLSPTGARAFAALDWLPVAELVDALQAELGSAPWPVLVSGPHDAAARAHRRFTPEEMNTLFGGEPKVFPTVDARPLTREALTELVAAFELPDWLATRAGWGLALVPGGVGVSRIGGRPDLPHGEWPLNDGRGLTHLATIALAELPEIEGREDLPLDGALVFFADFSEEHEGWGPADGNDPVIRILHVPAGAATRSAEPPDEPRDDRDVPVEIGERRVRFEPVLTLPDVDPDDLSDDEWEAYMRLTEGFDAVTPGLGADAHLMLGHPSVVQVDPREPGEINLLHLDYDEELNFMYGDAGDVTFYGTAEDIRAGQWNRVKAMPNSC